MHPHKTLRELRGPLGLFHRVVSIGKQKHSRDPLHEEVKRRFVAALED